MKLKQYFIFLIIVCFGFGSCEEMTQEIETEQIDMVIEPMKFDDLVVGQKYYFAYFVGESFYSDDNFNFEYTGDTLEVEIVSKEVNKTLVSETVTALSNVNVNEYDYYFYNKDSILYNYWSVENDSLVLSYGMYFSSHLLSRTSLDLEDFEGQEVEIKGWKPSYPFVESDVKLVTKDFTLFDNTYSKLNIFLNNKPMQVDGGGGMTFYNRMDGIVRTSSYSSWGHRGYGWDRIR